MPNTFVGGMSGSVTWSGVVLNVTGWKGTHSVEEHEVTHSGGGGAQNVIPGIQRLKGSFDANFDSSNPPYLTPPNLNPGVFAALRLNVGNTSRFYACSALITSMEFDSSVAGLVKYTATFSSDGPITLPTS